MKTKTLLLSLAIVVFLGCEKDKDESKEKSIIEFELQTIGDLDGGIFSDKVTLERNSREYQADNENGAFGGVFTMPETSDEYVDIVGWGNGLHPHLKQIYIRLPYEGEGTFSYDPQISDDKNIWVRIETTYSSELHGGNRGIGGAKTDITISITEITDMRIKGSFTASLVYYDVEMVGGGKRMNLNDEISYTNQPIVNGTFDLFRIDIN